MVRRLLDWSDKVSEKSIENDSEAKCYAKAAALGVMEGVIDGLVIYGIVDLGVTIFKAVKDAIKK